MKQTLPILLVYLCRQITAVWRFLVAALFRLEKSIKITHNLGINVLSLPRIAHPTRLEVKRKNERGQYLFTSKTRNVNKNLNDQTRMTNDHSNPNAQMTKQKDDPRTVTQLDEASRFAAHSEPSGFQYSKLSQ